MVTFSKPLFRVEVDDAVFKEPQSVYWLKPDGRARFNDARREFSAAVKGSRLSVMNISSKQAAEFVKAEVQKLRPDLPLTVSEYFLVGL